jgi:tetratricopeptide (TPR) repeat protein
MLGCGPYYKICQYCKSLFDKAALIERNNNIRRNKPQERKAVKMYKKILTRAQDNNQMMYGYLNIGEAYYRLGSYEKAVVNIISALKLRYNGPKAHMLLGLCYEALGDYKKAIKMLLKEETINPQDKKINFALLRCYHEIGRIGQRNKIVHKIISMVKAKNKQKRKLTE